MSLIRFKYSRSADSNLCSRTRICAHLFTFTLAEWEDIKGPVFFQVSLYLLLSLHLSTISLALSLFLSLAHSFALILAFSSTSQLEQTLELNWTFLTMALVQLALFFSSFILSLILSSSQLTVPISPVLPVPDDFIDSTYGKSSSTIGKFKKFCGRKKNIFYLYFTLS